MANFIFTTILSELCSWNPIIKANQWDGEVEFLEILRRSDELYSDTFEKKTMKISASLIETEDPNETGTGANFKLKEAFYVLGSAAPTYDAYRAYFTNEDNEKAPNYFPYKEELKVISKKRNLDSCTVLIKKKDSEHPQRVFIICNDPAEEAVKFRKTFNSNYDDVMANAPDEDMPTLPAGYQTDIKVFDKKEKDFDDKFILLLDTTFSVWADPADINYLKTGTEYSRIEKCGIKESPDISEEVTNAPPSLCCISFTISWNDNLKEESILCSPKKAKNSCKTQIRIIKNTLIKSCDKAVLEIAEAKKAAAEKLLNKAKLSGDAEAAALAAKMLAEAQAAAEAERRRLAEEAARRAAKEAADKAARERAAKDAAEGEFEQAGEAEAKEKEEIEEEINKATESDEPAEEDNADDDKAKAKVKEQKKEKAKKLAEKGKEEVKNLKPSEDSVFGGEGEGKGGKGKDGEGGEGEGEGGEGKEGEGAGGIKGAGEGEGEGKEGAGGEGEGKEGEGKDKTGSGEGESSGGKGTAGSESGAGKKGEGEGEEGGAGKGAEGEGGKRGADQGEKGKGGKEGEGSDKGKKSGEEDIESVAKRKEFGDRGIGKDSAGGKKGGKGSGQEGKDSGKEGKDGAEGKSSESGASDETDSETGSEGEGSGKEGAEGKEGKEGAGSGEGEDKTKSAVGGPDPFAPKEAEGSSADGSSSSKSSSSSSSDEDSDSGDEKGTEGKDGKKGALFEADGVVANKNDDGSITTVDTLSGNKKTMSQEDFDKMKSSDSLKDLTKSMAKSQSSQSDSKSSESNKEGTEAKGAESPLGALPPLKLPPMKFPDFAKKAKEEAENKLSNLVSDMSKAMAMANANALDAMKGKALSDIMSKLGPLISAATDPSKKKAGKYGLSDEALNSAIAQAESITSEIAHSSNAKKSVSSKAMQQKMSQLQEEIGSAFKNTLAKNGFPFGAGGGFGGPGSGSGGGGSGGTGSGSRSSSQSRGASSASASSSRGSSGYGSGGKGDKGDAGDQGNSAIDPVLAAEMEKLKHLLDHKIRPQYVSSVQKGHSEEKEPTDEGELGILHKNDRPRKSIDMIKVLREVHLPLFRLMMTKAARIHKVGELIYNEYIDLSMDFDLIIIIRNYLKK